MRLTSGELEFASTDLERSIVVSVTAILESDGEPAVWRVGPDLLSGLAASLPIGSTQSVTLGDNHNGSLAIASGDIRAELPMIDAPFPIVERFETDAMAEAVAFSSKIRQVAWACKDKGVLSGVHIGGGLLVATDSAVVAMTQCDAGLGDAELTVPLGTMTSLLSNTDEIRIAVGDGGHKLHLAPNGHTWLTAVTYAEDYPDMVKAAEQLTDKLGDAEFVVPREALAATLKRIMLMARREDYPYCDVTLSDGQLRCELFVEGSGFISDAIDVNFDGHYSVRLDPQKLLKALDSFVVDPTLTFGKEPTMAFRLAGGGHTVFMTTRRITEAGK